MKRTEYWTENLNIILDHLDIKATPEQIVSLAEYCAVYENGSIPEEGDLCPVCDGMLIHPEGSDHLECDGCEFGIPAEH